jgi:hypothetical protein
MKQVRPDHPYLVSFMEEEGHIPFMSEDRKIFQLDDCDWPIYSIAVYKVPEQDSVYGTAGFAFGLSIKRQMDFCWEPVDTWNPLPNVFAPVIIEMLKGLS